MDRSQTEPLWNPNGEAPSTARNDPSQLTRIRTLSAEQLTKYFLQYLLKRRRTKVILVVGLMRAGKSRLFESITGTEGHAGSGIKSVTQKYALHLAKIDGEHYMFVDTPGFGDANCSDEDVFRQIAEFIDLVQNSVVFAGVLYVHRMETDFSTDAGRLLKWLKAFCGNDHAPFVTFVTTRWDAIVEDEMEDAGHKLQQWKSEWSVLISRGAQVYNHGKFYDSIGRETSRILRIRVDGDERARQVQNMITRNYRHKNYVDPQFVKEIKHGRSVETTTAAQILGMTTRAIIIADQSTTSTSEPGYKADWIGMLTSLLMPVRQAFWDTITMLSEFVKFLLSFLPTGTWYWPRFGRRGIEFVIQMPLGTKIVVGWGREGYFAHVQRDDEDDNDPDLDDMDIMDIDNWDVEDETIEAQFPSSDGTNQVLSGFGDEDEERQFVAAFERAQHEHEQMEDNGGPSGCTLM